MLGKICHNDVSMAQDSSQLCNDCNLARGGKILAAGQQRVSETCKNRTHVTQLTVTCFNY